CFGRVSFVSGLHVLFRCILDDIIIDGIIVLRRIRVISDWFDHRGSGRGGLLSAAPNAARERSHCITGH
ncbi:MAG: hypothetical protein KY445_02270, partial [Armatimonadetes bacterium]|nr:hypothetical protein [Armatimonadota bacterium]